jgi:hypothetical protein
MGNYISHKNVRQLLATKGGSVYIPNTALLPKDWDLTDTDLAEMWSSASLLNPSLTYGHIVKVMG